MTRLWMRTASAGALQKWKGNGMSEDYEFLQQDDGVFVVAAAFAAADPPVEERVARLEDLVGRLYETACAEQKKLIAEAMRT